MNPTAQAKNALSNTHKIRQEVFQYYKSAEAHTGHSHVKSRWWYIIIAMLILLPILLGLIGYMSYRYYQGYKAKAQIETTAEEQSASGVLTGSLPKAEEIIAQPMQQNSLKPEMFVPVLAERPESKPIYDTVRQVKSYERIAGCMQQGKSCNCYSDQATKLREISTAMCLDYVRNGLPFDPFRESNPPARPQEPQLAQSEQP